MPASPEPDFREVAIIIMTTTPMGTRTISPKISISKMPGIPKKANSSMIGLLRIAVMPGG